jgi:outer membrane protein OmpA-like peptidoglycan-associated protein
MHIQPSRILLAALIGAAGLSLGACATEDYVDQQIATVNTRIQGVDTKVDALSGRVDTVNQAAQAAMQRANDAHTLAEGKLIYGSLGTEEVLFDTNKYTLSDEAKSTLSALAERLKSENKNVHLQLAGHGDPRGSTMQNRVLGEKRALEVRRFLIGQGIPVDRVDTVSWGEEQQKAVDGSGAEALQANRRVVITIVG